MVLFFLMLVITALNMLHRLLKVKDKLPFSFSVVFFSKDIVKSAHNCNVHYILWRQLGLCKNKVV